MKCIPGLKNNREIFLKIFSTHLFRVLTTGYIYTVSDEAYRNKSFKQMRKTRIIPSGQSAGRKSDPRVYKGGYDNVIFNEQKFFRTEHLQ